jgi:hypothetical protein
MEVLITRIAKLRRATLRARSIDRRIGGNDAHDARAAGVG